MSLIAGGGSGMVLGRGSRVTISSGGDLVERPFLLAFFVHGDDSCLPFWFHLLFQFLEIGGGRSVPLVEESNKLVKIWDSESGWVVGSGKCGHERWGREVWGEYLEICEAIPHESFDVVVVAFVDGRGFQYDGLYPQEGGIISRVSDGIRKGGGSSLPWVGDVVLTTCRFSLGGGGCSSGSGVFLGPGFSLWGRVEGEVPKISSERDTRDFDAMCWAIELLRVDSELEPFIEVIPNVITCTDLITDPPGILHSTPSRDMHSGRARTHNSTEVSPVTTASTAYRSWETLHFDEQMLKYINLVQSGIPSVLDYSVSTLTVMSRSLLDVYLDQILKLETEIGGFVMTRKWYHRNPGHDTDLAHRHSDLVLKRLHQQLDELEAHLSGSHQEFALPCTTMETVHQALGGARRHRRSPHQTSESWRTS
ncbi:hypothetical protein EV421DRAFT_1906438 [Armillaria borealis]|uniref:Uncharacterized protein n=1 Tax=Armillaria borealis TaxID=47425 RepID=A0AA39JCH7_9AGAR|nr:hypothetical protein EV421DRAFT_1906438 [Armillaria borealis]